MVGWNSGMRLSPIRRTRLRYCRASVGRNLFNIAHPKPATDQSRAERTDFAGLPSLLVVLHRMQRLVMIVDNPLLIVGERNEAPFQPLKLAHLVGAARGLYQLSVFGRFRTILFGREHR